METPIIAGPESPSILFWSSVFSRLVRHDGCAELVRLVGACRDSGVACRVGAADCARERGLPVLLADERGRCAEGGREPVPRMRWSSELFLCTLFTNRSPCVFAMSLFIVELWTRLVDEGRELRSPAKIKRSSTARVADFHPVRQSSSTGPPGRRGLSNSKQLLIAKLPGGCISPPLLAFRAPRERIA